MAENKKIGTLRKIHNFIFKNPNLRSEFNKIIEGTDTPQGKLFDVILIWAIITSVAITIIESMVLPPLVKDVLKGTEWFFTIFFSIELFMRLYCSDKPLKYLFSFFGIIDTLSILPSYMAFFFPEAHALMVIRVFRVIRVMRIFKLVSYVSEAKTLLNALRQSLRKILVFALFVFLLVIVIGSVAYIAEGGQENTNFSNIPNSIYWAVVTLTTVGYGDMSPETGFGRFFTTVVMLLGYTILSVPTGIFSAEMVKQEKGNSKNKKCPSCGKKGHENNAIYCRHCGGLLIEDNSKKQ